MEIFESTFPNVSTVVRERFLTALQFSVYELGYLTLIQIIITDYNYKVSRDPTVCHGRLSGSTLNYISALGLLVLSVL